MNIEEIRNKIIDRVCDSLMPISKYTDKEVEVFVDDLLSKLIQSKAKELEKENTQLKQKLKESENMNKELGEEMKILNNKFLNNL